MSYTKAFFEKNGSIGGKQSWREENRPWRLKQLAKARKKRSKNAANKRNKK